jgi:hypothetical protein
VREGLEQVGPILETIPDPLLKYVETVQQALQRGERVRDGLLERRRRWLPVPVFDNRVFGSIQP